MTDVCDFDVPGAGWQVYTGADIVFGDTETTALLNARRLRPTGTERLTGEAANTHHRFTDEDIPF